LGAKAGLIWKTPSTPLAASPRAFSIIEIA
jgi:hypothetical protein